MRLRTFTATDMPAALKLVREALGDHAVIIASEPLKDKKLLRITAAVDEQDEHGVADFVKQSPKPAPAPIDTDNAGDSLRYAIQSILRFHNVPELFIAKLMRKVSEVDIPGVMAQHRLNPSGGNLHLHRLALEALLAAYFTFDPLLLGERKISGCLQLMLVGPPGVGKTLTIAKIATRIAMNKESLAIISTDNTRAGGIEQLQAFTDILGLPLMIAEDREELAAHLHGLPPHTHILVDTAGCNPYSPQELQALKYLAPGDVLEPVLVLPAGSDSLEAVDITEAFSLLPIRRLLVTRADTARRFGGIIAAAAAHELAFCHVSNSSSIANTLNPLNPSLLAQLLLKYQRSGGE